MSKGKGNTRPAAGPSAQRTDRLEPRGIVTTEESTDGAIWKLISYHALIVTTQGGPRPRSICCGYGAVHRLDAEPRITPPAGAQERPL